jgi:CO/xanthine dehydrogenase Mo-binding subunit
MSESQYVGKNAEWVDGQEKVTGRARFIADYRLPGMLYAKVRRSPVPHARIVTVDVTAALKVPGVLAAVTSEDFVDHGRFGWPVRDSYALAHGKVRYVGDPIAAVAAETQEAAEAGVRAVILELEELPGVFDPEEALKPEAPLVPLASPSGEGNLVEKIIVRSGDPDPALARCHTVMEETYQTPHQEHAYLETEGALAMPEDGGVTVYANIQSPFNNRQYLSTLLGLPAEMVRVIQPFVGGSFGGKDDIGYQNSAQTAALALKTGRPVRLVLSREESMLASYKREAMRARVTLGADSEGNLKAAKIRAVVDSGAYPSTTPLAAWRGTVHLAGAYRYQAVHVDTLVAYTNNGYAGAFRGFGNTDAAAIIEQAIDELAHRLGRDPIDFRLQNCLRRGDRTMTGNPVQHEVGLSQCLQWVREHSEWDRRREAYARLPPDHDIRLGIGAACYFNGVGLGGEGEIPATTTMEVTQEYTVRVASGLTDYGQGSRTVFTLIAAETLGVHPDRVQILRPDTATAIDSGPTVASRSSIMGGNATRVAASKIDRLLRWAAADLLGCNVGELARSGEDYVGPSEEPASFKDVVDHARAMGLILSARGRWEIAGIDWDFKTGTGVPYPAYTFGAQVAEIEADRRTGEIRVLAIWAAHDGGRILFPQGARGQMLGAIAQGLGYGLLEDAVFQEGYPQHVNFDGYLIPTSVDMPVVNSTFIETDFPEGPYGAKNLAEPPILATAPAIANAYFHATGVRLRELPITLERSLLGRSLHPVSAKDSCRLVLGG